MYSYYSDPYIGIKIAGRDNVLKIHRNDICHDINNSDDIINAENGKFSSWMMRIVHNHLIDYYRTNPIGLVISNDESEVDLFNNADIAVNENREKEMIDQQTLKEIKELIALLPDPQREVLLMRVKDELSFKEIADKTNCSINTALGRMRYAILNLRHMAYERGISLAS